MNTVLAFVDTTVYLVAFCNLTSKKRRMVFQPGNFR